MLIVLLAAQAWGTQRRHPARPATIPDPGYVAALGTANRFLNAWAAGDLETGMVLLGDRVRRTRDAETVEQFFAAGQARGFEITRGQGHAGRYRFPVVLVTRQSNRVRRVFSEIILVNSGKDDWAVDKLP